jgi:Kae1-associated kinase Bud32
MKPRIIQQGAEAIITLTDNKISKHRIKKSYRLPSLDKSLRASRTRAEAKIISKLKNLIPVPEILEINEDKKEIIMEFIDGKKLSQHLEKLDYKKISKLIGQAISKLHDQDIIHGDLTTSNMIFKNEKVYLIDFGLGFHSYKIEDKAVDLHLLKQALDAKHFTISDECMKIILENYKADKHEAIIQRIKAIERRGRYRGH